MSRWRPIRSRGLRNGNARSIASTRPPGWWPGLGNYIFNQTGGFERFGPLAYYGAVCEVEFAGDTLKAVRFKPLALSMDGTPEKPRGVPYLAQGGEAAAILGRLADISRQRHGTEMRVQGTSAEVVLR